MNFALTPYVQTTRRLVRAGAVMYLLLSSLTMAYSAQADESRFNPHRTGAYISVNGQTTDLDLMSAMVMPGETISIRADEDLTVEAPQGELTKVDGGWDWRAPDAPGLVRLSLKAGDRQMTLHGFVLTPLDTAKADKIGRYKIGNYKQTTMRGLKNTTPPRGFIKYTPDLKGVSVSPHFTLDQFLCKQQPGETPQYLLLEPALLIKLETLLEHLNGKGYPMQTFHVMSGWRSPWYNSSIGNKTSRSRHLYGDAADIYVDEDGDKMMDDLNQDGVSDAKDARIIFEAANALALKSKVQTNLSKSLTPTQWKPGGLSQYKANSAHGPFVHVDARGVATRW